MNASEVNVTEASGKYFQNALIAQHTGQKQRLQENLALYGDRREIELAARVDTSPEARDRLAGMFAEVYRGIYPYMTEKTHAMIKAYVIAEPGSPKRTGSAARKLATRIVTKHYRFMDNPGPELPRESFITDQQAAELAGDKEAIGRALKYSGNRAIEIDCLTSQLRAIPALLSIMTSSQAIGDGFSNWVSNCSLMSERMDGPTRGGRSSL